MGTIKIYDDLEISKFDERIFSSFLEHMGRAIYTGIYEPSHPTADEHGFRQDVIDLVKELNVSYVRYPGGNFVSGYNWKDGVGEHRPTKIDYAWRSIESNQIGINEFVQWCKKANVLPMGAVNLGSGSFKDAADLLEYCNFPCGTELSDLRIKHGYKQPHGIKYWCLGNEMDGPWQTGALTADQYGQKALQTARIMKAVDSDIKLVLVGSSNSSMDTFPEWDRTVLEYCYDEIDYLSLHQYYENEGDNQKFLLSCYDLDSFVNSVHCTVQYVKALKRSEKNVKLSLDEWNVWNYSKWNNSGYDVRAMEDLEHHPRLLEDRYSYLDTIVFTSLLVTILNNTDKIEIACLAQLVNVIAPIFTEINGDVVKQGIFYPFALVANNGCGTVIQNQFNSEVIKHNNKEYDSLVAATVKYEDDLFVYAVNVNAEKEIQLDFEFDANYEFVEAYELYSTNLDMINDFDSKENIVLNCTKEFKTAIPACSFVTYKFQKVGK